MQKIRYEIDPHNRLVRRLPRFRKVIDGKFKIDKKNTLIYHVKAPVPRDANRKVRKSKGTVLILNIRLSTV